MKVDLNRIIAIDFLIRHKCTNTPEELAKRLGVSKRTLHFTISIMKDKFNAPIIYNRHRRSYIYKEEGYVILSFQKGKPPLGNPVSI
jgi:predicted transcriptional regulator